MSFKWYLLQSVVMSIFSAIVGYQLEFKVPWFLCGLFIGLSAFNLLGWLQEAVDEARRELNQRGIHYVDGKRYRLVRDKKPNPFLDCWTNTEEKHDNG